MVGQRLAPELLDDEGESNAAEPASRAPNCEGEAFGAAPDRRITRVLERQVAGIARVRQQQ
jgi:hypothetical protein